MISNTFITHLYCQSETEEIKQLSVSKYFLGYKYYYGNVLTNRNNFYELADLVPNARENVKMAK